MLYSKQSVVPRNHRTGYWRNDSIPLEIFVKKDVKLPNNIKISFNSSSRGLWIPNTIKITPELCRLLGYYIAEGGCDKNVNLRFGKNDLRNGIIDDAIKCINKVFGIHSSSLMPQKNPVTGKECSYSICFGGKLLSLIFKHVFKVGDDVYSKQVPYAMFNISKELKLEFLKAYIFGDGHSRIRLPKNRKNWSIEVSAKTVSKKLISDLVILSFQLGLFPSIEEGKSKEHMWNGQRVKASKSFRIIFSSKNDIMKLSGLFGNRDKLEKYLQCSKQHRCVAGLPKEMFSKGYVFKLKDKKLRKYFFDRLNSKSCKIFDYDKLALALNELKSDSNLLFIKNLIKNKIYLLQIKQIKTIKPTGHKVYDLEIRNTNMFVGGIGPIVLHNSGGGIIWALQSAKMLVDCFPDIDKYNRGLKEFFEPRIFTSKVVSKLGVIVGNELPFLVPKRIYFDSDWIF